MKTKISLLLLAILCNFSVFAQSDFDKYFEKKSLRVDFALSGNLKSQSAAIQGLREEPVWGGPVKNLIDKFNYGGYYILKSASNLNGNLNCSKELEHYAS